MNTIKASVFLFFCLFIFNSIVAQQPASCPNPTSLSANTLSPTEVEFTWNTTGSETQWEIIIQMQGGAAPGTNVSGEAVSSMSYLADFLIPFTGYDVYVRAICSATENSSWTGPFNYYTPVINDSCANAIALTVNSNNQCANTTQAVFLGATVSAEPGYCGDSNDGDIWFTFTSTNRVHVVELNNFSGSFLPIVLTMYQGTGCGDLNQMYCSSVNHLTATGLVAGQLYYVRVSINGLNTPKDVTFNICVNIPGASGSNNSRECLINAVNSNFESPVYTNNSVNFINHNAMQGWRTTASDGIIEVWNNYEGVTAYSGSQFIELNAYEASGVYQDFDTPISTVFNYSFAHRGRQGTDVCGLYAGPPGGPYELIFTATTGTAGWGYYTGTYTIPDGQTETRFKFEAISAAGGLTVGNFLDDVTFTANNGIISLNPVVLDCSVNVASLIVAGGTGTWSAHLDNPSVTTISDLNSNSPTITGFSAPGIYMYTWTTLYCTDTLLVEFFGAGVDDPVTNAVSYCLNATAAPLTATALPGTILKWYTTPTGGTALATAPVTNTTVAGTTTYYVSQSTLTSTCESVRVPLSVTVNQPTAVAVTLNYGFSKYCLPGATIVPQPGTLPGGTYTATGGLQVDPATGAVNLQNAVAGQYIITYTINASATNCTGEGLAFFTLNLTESVTPQVDFFYESLCYSDQNAMPVLPSGFVSGGVFESTDGLSVNGVTGAINVSASTPGSYTISYFIAADAQNCSSSATGRTTVIIDQPLGFSVSGECDGGNYILTVQGNYSGSVLYTWTDANGNEAGSDDRNFNVTEYLRLNPGVVMPNNGLLFNVAINVNGCEYVVNHTVTSAFCNIPKGISPNGDAFNEAFDLTGLGVAKLVIYNRYGKEVYQHGANYTNQWHGQTNGGNELPDATYFYYILTNNNSEYTGWVYINR